MGIFMTEANRSNEALITQEYLKSILHYDTESGYFTWKIRKSGVIGGIGAIAGSLDKSTGYNRLSINRILYLAHRLAWLYMTGNWPEFIIDHIEGINVPNFNKWSNLRHITQKDNTHSKIENNGIATNNTTGYSGVDLHKGSYRARITVDGKQIHLGYFTTPEEGSESYKTAKLIHHAIK
jgi:hypothetical protein